MSEMELKVTVKGSNIGDKVRHLVVDGDANEDGIVLASNGYTLDVVKVERADGLPLAIEEEFYDWIKVLEKDLTIPVRTGSKNLLFKAYCAGRAVK